MLVSGSTVLLTGATGGLGSAIARDLAERGAELILSGRQSEPLERLAGELGARALPADLAEPAQVDRLIVEAGEPDILIANAALPASGRLDSYTVTEIDRALDINLRAPIVLAHGLAPTMVRRGSGHLLFMSSISGKVATPGTALYCASKFGLRAFASSMRADLRSSGVGVSAVFPGFISEAGMYADSGVGLPPGVGTRSPHDVALAVVKAIEHNRGEIDVAALPVRVGAILAGLAPEASAAAQRRLGAEGIARAYEVAQRDMR